MVVIICLVWLFWFYYHAEVRDAVRWVRWSQMWVISHFVPDDFTVMYMGREVSFHDGMENTTRYTQKSLDYNHLSYFTSLAMQPLKIVFTLGFVLMAVWAYLKGPKTQFRETLGLEGLMKRQAQVFPVIQPFVGFNPSKQPPRAPGSPVPAELPLFAEALGPEEWIAYNNIPVPDGQLDEEKCQQAFSKQLGKRWGGWQKLEPYQQVLLASFCLKASRKRSEADAMLSRIAKCWDHKKGLRLNKDRSLVKDARNILKNGGLSKSTLAKCNQHAFQTTALLKALENARNEGGVLAPAQFVWLRGHDRNLWYPLNNLGRQSFHAEALGAMAHFQSERRTSRPIPVPKVKDAVDMLKEYMGTNKARPIPQLDYSQSKKRGIKKVA